MDWKSYISEFIRYAFIILLFYAAISKFIEYHQFYSDLLNSPIFFGNKRVAVFISWFIPIIELAIAGLLSNSKYRDVGMYLASGLILIFTLYIVWVLKFSDDIPCSCGGIISNFTWQEHLIFNTLFLFLGGLGIFLQKEKRIFIK